jgi:hypothetical protein
LTDGRGSSRGRDTGQVAWYAHGMRRTHAGGGSRVDETNASASLPSPRRARHEVHPRPAKGGARLRLMHVAAALAFASCGGLENGSGIGEGGPGSTDGSGQDTSSGSTDASGDDAGSTDASGREGGPTDSGLPDTGGAACVQITSMCTSVGLSSPCWYCPPSFFAQCPAAGGAPFNCSEYDGLTCFSCGFSHSGPAQGTLETCEGDPPEWKPLRHPSCSY